MSRVQDEEVPDDYSGKTNSIHISETAAHMNNEPESSDDEGGGGATFHGCITGFVNKARGTGDATAYKRTIHVGSSRESTSSESGDGLQIIYVL